MQIKAFIFTAILSGLGTLLFGQNTQANTSFLPSTQPGAPYISASINPTGGTATDRSQVTSSVISGDHIADGSIAPPMLIIAPATIPDGIYGSAYDQTLTVTGGHKPYTFSVSGGSLPPNMSLTADGDLSGAPTAIGTYSFTITVEDSSPIPLTQSQDYTLIIDQAVLTITANNATMPYGGTFPVLGVSYSGFVNGDDASSLSSQPSLTSLPATPSSPVGSYTITAFGAADPNYSINYVNGILSITPVALTITANNASMTYGGAVPSLSASYTGFVNGDNASSLTTQPALSTMASPSSPAGSYTITPSGAVDPNYNISYVTGSLTITPAALTIRAKDTSMTYGGAVPSLVASYIGFVNGDNASSLTTQPTLSTTATQTSPAGTYPITVSGAVDPNYTVTYQAGTMTVGKATLTVTADNKTMPLGGPLPAFTVSYTGFVNGDNAASLATKPTATTTATAASPAGTYPITPSGGSSSNYTFNFVNGVLAVGKALLTITANPASSVYGAALVPAGSLTVSYSGFVNGDGPGSMTVPPIVTNSAFAGAPAGSYTLTPSGAVNPNYNIVYVNGNYTINPATLTITADNKTMPLGGPLPILTISYTGFVNGDNASSLTIKPTATTTATAASPVGSYPITPSGGSSSNYTFTYVNGTLAVAKAFLTVTANPASSTYGAPLVPNGSLTVSYSGFVNGDGPSSMTVQPIVTNAAFAGAPAGSYSLIPSGAVNPNYTIQYVNGNYTIKPATLTVAADNKSMPLGGPLPNLTISYAGFVNGDNASSLTTQPTATTTATAASPAGTYTIIPSGGSSHNYTFSYVNGILAVGKALLTITANAASSTYGSPLIPNSSLTFSYSGFVNGDGPGSMTVPPIVSNTAVTGSPVGNYTLIPSGAVNPNYVIAYVNGIYTIKPANLTVTADNKTMPLGGPLPTLTVSYSGFVNGDNASSLTSPPMITTSATSSSPAGTYPITPSGAFDPNYNFTYTPGTLTVNAASLHVTANAQTKEYGAPDPTLTYTVTGLINGDNTSIFSGSLSRTSGENVGTYLITQGSLSAGSNYTFSYTGNYLTIKVASQQITWGQSLVVGCNHTTQVQLTAKASSGLPVTYSVSDPNVATVSGNVLTLLQPGIALITATQVGDANHTAAPPVTDTVFYQAASLIRQHWSDAIFFDNSSGDYVQWQWYKGGEAVSGATNPFYSESTSLNGQYYVIATNTAGQQVQSCTLTITGGAAIAGGIKVYPNPANTGALVTLTINYPSAALQNARLQIVDITGRVRQEITNVQPSMQITMPSETGMYIINLLLASGEKSSTNVLVD